MNSIPLLELAEAAGGQLHGPGHSNVLGFALDSREVKPGDVFLAVRGANVDGHDFVDAALASGAVACIVERTVAGPHILVSNLVQAIALIGTYFRSKFSGPVVGITGSVGKTSTKEFLAAALAPLGPVLKSQGNRNTEYSSPLLWPELEASHRAAIVEMGMRGFGQIAQLASVAKPTIGLVTNIGHAHLDLVGTRDGIALAKSELLEALPEGGLAILWAEDDYLEFLRERTRGPVKTFGFSSGADSRIINYSPTSWTTASLSGVTDGMSWSTNLPAAGRHMALNAAACILIASDLGIEPPIAASALSKAQLPPLRMELRECRGATIVLDAYNASPSSMVAAIETLAELPCEGRRMAVIGGMRELGSFSEEGHRSVGESLASNRIDRAIFYGEGTDVSLRAATGVDGRMAATLDEVTRFLNEARPGDTVLIKGSRAMELEKALQPLLEATH